MNNLWDTQVHIGGSDNSLWMDGICNTGPSLSGLQTGTYADNGYEMIFDSLSKTSVGMIYISAMNGWRGLKISGNSNSGGIHFHGGVYEGYNGSTWRAPGTILRIEGGAGSFHGGCFGQAMSGADAAEGGYIHMTGGQWSFFGPNFFRGLTSDTVPAIRHTGGRLLVMGAAQAMSETWTTRPIIDSDFVAAAGGGPNTVCCPDLSMNIT